MSHAPFSLIIATFERANELSRTFAGIECQSRKPAEIIVVDSSLDAASRQLCEEWSARLPLRWYHSHSRSAARQRNEGAELSLSSSAVLGFMDDDITLESDACEKVLFVFEQDASEEVGGVAVRINEIHRPVPSWFTRFYYRLQAGFSDPTYSARLFGPAINCLPCYDEPGDGMLVRADWLNSGCVFYRRTPFLRERFPAFEGYSFMEDVHCSARIARTHRLYFHTAARCSHRDGANALKGDMLGMARQRIRNQRIVAREVLGLSGFEMRWKFFLHRLFITFAILRQRKPGWLQGIRGTWI